MESVINLENFETRIREQLKESDEDHKERFDEFKRFLSNLNLTNCWETNRGVQILVVDFLKLIEETRSLELKSEHFKDLMKELQAHLLRKPEIKLTESEIQKRQKRIDRIKKEMIRLDCKIKRLNDRELSLDDLDKEEDNILCRIDIYKKKVIRYYNELRKLENKTVYYGDDNIDFSDLSENESLNEFLAREILIKFLKTRNEPDYAEVVELINKFIERSGGNFNCKEIFKKICLRLRNHNVDQLKTLLNYYLNDEAQIEENEELRKKLDSQNKFQDELEKVIEKFVEKADKQASSDQIGSDEESEDSESDSIDTYQTISENEEEFIGEQRSSEDSMSDCDDKDDYSQTDQSPAVSTANPSTNKRKSDDSETKNSKSLKPDDRCIILD